MVTARTQSTILNLSSPQATFKKIRCWSSSLTRLMASTPSPDADHELSLSTVHRGTAFEHRAMIMLRDLSMSLSRIGGRNDGGVDLQGWWWLPERSSNSTDFDADGIATDNAGVRRRRVRVLAQCKAERKKLGPNYVREMEGVLHRHLHVSPNDAHAKMLPTVALLVSESAFTKATVLCALSSPLPFFLLHLPRVPTTSRSISSDEATDQEGLDTFGSAIWNPALGGQRGVLEGAVDLRWDLSPVSGTRSHPSLWWRGTRLKSWVPLSER